MPKRLFDLSSYGRDLHLMYSLIGHRRTLTHEAKSMRQQPFVIFVYFVVKWS